MRVRALDGQKWRFPARAQKWRFPARAVSPNDVATGAETVGAEMRVRSIRAVRAIKSRAISH
jgi:hypothetical protein